MIELPEAYTIAQQINKTLLGKQIHSGMRGNAPHKFAFYTGSLEEYEAILAGKTIGHASYSGALILIPVEPGYLLVLGYGGERINYHPNAESLPKKHQLLVQFVDRTYLSVTVQGWGFCQLLNESDLPTHPQLGKPKVSPLSDLFTFEYFSQLFVELKEKDSRSIKFFLVSDPGVWGIGNGCLQDILFDARLDPRHKAASLSISQRIGLYQVIQNNLKQMAGLGGRDTEHDLYNQPGGYHSRMTHEAVNKPCPNCRTPIEKIQFQGGSCYICRTCQV